MPDTTRGPQSDRRESLIVEKSHVSESQNWLKVLACLLTILGFAFWIRLPMIVHADRHMDSDLAVDGLVLREYLRTGKLAGAYPGTPHIATLPVFLSLPVVPVWGDSPAALVFSGTAAAMLMIVPVFCMAQKAYGLVPAILAGIVLAAGGLGQIWLSARVTGGHLLAAAWLAWIWWIWGDLISRRSVLVWFGFGMVCSVALFSDQIFVLGLAGVGIATLAAIFEFRNSISITRRCSQGIWFLISLAGSSFVLYERQFLRNSNAYGDQFATTTAPAAIIEHLRLLFLECLPRLIFGRILPTGSTGVTFTHPGAISNDAITDKSPVVWILLGISVIAIVMRFISKRVQESADFPSASKDIRWLGPMRLGLLATTLLTFLAFVINRNIYNSDNYRYLVLLLPGLYMAVARIAAAGTRQSLRRVLVIAFASFLTLDTLVWQTKVGFRSGLMPSRRSQSKAAAGSFDLVDLLKSNPHLINGDFEADYWEVYRALYLAELPIESGQPFGFFPNRFFPADAFPKSQKSPQFVVITKSPTSMQILAQIRNEGARRVFSSPNLEIYERVNVATTPDRPDQNQTETP